jgi:hypothetical protein
MWEDNSKIDLREIICENVNWFELPASDADFVYDSRSQVSYVYPIL